MHIFKAIGQAVSLAVFLFSTTAALSQSADPLQIVVSLKQQKMHVYRGDKHVISSKISSGKTGHTTPSGIFSIIQKNRRHKSNIYSGAPMPFMQRITWSGIALHASNHVPRYPASHGCIRMPHRFAGKLFKMRTNGNHVIVEQNPSAPSMIDHEVLFQPLKTWKPSKKFDPWVNAIIDEENLAFIDPMPQYPARIFITRRTYKDDLKLTQKILNRHGYNAGKVDGIMGPDTWQAVTKFQKANGMEPDGKINDTFLKLLYKKTGIRPPANGRLLVRKHQSTVYDAQINIVDPEKPLGSHLLVVAGFDAKKSKTRWTGITLNDSIQTKLNLGDNRIPDVFGGRVNLHDTLSRIEMSPHDRKQVSRLLSSSSSITISDNGMSIETGEKGTDFIVLTKPGSALSEVAGESRGEAG